MNTPRTNTGNLAPQGMIEDPDSLETQPVVYRKVLLRIVFWALGLDLEAFIRKAAKLGYSAVELMGKRPHLSPLDFDSGKLDRSKQCAKENRILEYL